MNLNTSWTPEFGKIDLLALYVTMYLKRIVTNKLPWKEHLDILCKEVKSNLKDLGKDKEQYLFPTLKDFSRIYSDQWSLKELGLEVGHPTYQTLLLVLVLRLGVTKLWVPDSFYFREDILIDGFLSLKPKLSLTYLSQLESLFDCLVPLCPNLTHVSVPLSDNALFMKTMAIKSLRILEFSTGVADKVLCNALWNIDKKSDKVLQLAIKDKKDGNFATLSLPHLEVLRSNIHKREDGLGSMKVTLGAAALVLQPKLRLVENKMYWTTLQAIQTLIDTEQKYKIKHQRRLAVTQLVFDPLHIRTERFSPAHHFGRLLDICPGVNDVIFTYCSQDIDKLISPLITLERFAQIESIAFDATLISVRDLQDLLFSLGKNIKYLTLKISMELIDKFYPIKNSKSSEVVTRNMLPSLKSLSLVLSEKKKARESGKGYMPTSMISFLSWFSRIHTLNYFNVLRVSSLFVVYECIGGAMAVIQNLKHLTINGFTMMHPADLCKRPLDEQDVQVQDLLPELLGSYIPRDVFDIAADATFKILKDLTSFSIDALFLSPGVDRLLEVLRTSNVHVKVMDRPSTMKGADPSRYLDSSDLETMYAASEFGDYD